MLEKNKIYQGNALEVLKTFPEKSINCVVTSPPYWALRDYGMNAQLGLEPNFNDYINKLCDIFDETKRVLRNDGTLWVNMGDTYYNKSGSGFENDNISKDNKGKGIKKSNEIRGGSLLQSKSLCNIPARFSIEMQNRGWILRNVIIWHKPSCMPSSVKDRFTVDFEYVYFFVKNKKYWFEQQKKKIGSVCERNRSTAFRLQNENKEDKIITQGRNKRTVWKISPKPYKEAHFATYPKDLIEPMIKAGCPEFVCDKCGFAKEKKYNIKRSYSEVKSNTLKGKLRKDGKGEYRSNSKETGGVSSLKKVKEIGNTSCNCNAGFSGGIVLDPFMGSGTTGVVALEQNKKFIGIELNPEYIKLANKKLKPLLEQQKLNKWF